MWRRQSLWPFVCHAALSAEVTRRQRVARKAAPVLQRRFDVLVERLTRFVPYRLGWTNGPGASEQRSCWATQDTLDGYSVYASPSKKYHAASPRTPKSKRCGTWQQPLMSAVAVRGRGRRQGDRTVARWAVSTQRLRGVRRTMLAADGRFRQRTARALHMIARRGSLALCRQICVPRTVHTPYVHFDVDDLRFEWDPA